MIRLLAISDQPSGYLEQRLNPSIPIDYLLSCGDLHHSYLEQLSSQSNQVLHYINGNHDYMKPNDKNQFGIDLHTKLIETDDMLLCGFSGVKWYKNDAYQFHEHQMNRLTKKVLFNLWLRKIKLSMFKHPVNKPLIVLSHTPPLGIHDSDTRTHKGFKCFLDFIKIAKPLLWLHGHIHLQAFNEIKKTVYKKTTILNVYEFKHITIDNRTVEISYKF